MKDYFSAADFVVQPYKTATQSGVTQIAYQFCTPMVVTDVGGLAEIVPDGKVGYVCAPTAEAIAAAVERISDDGTLALFRRNCVGERRRFSWERMCDRVTELYGWFPALRSAEQDACHRNSRPGACDMRQALLLHLFGAARATS